MALTELTQDEPLPAYQPRDDASTNQTTRTSEKIDRHELKSPQKFILTAFPMSPTSPTSPEKEINSRPKSRRKNSGSSNTTTRRPQYSRKYSTPPSRPLSPVGYPQLSDVPELDLDSSSTSSFSLYQKSNMKRPTWSRDLDQQLTVDTAPQEPDIFEDPETDYFTSSELPPSIPRSKDNPIHSRQSSSVARGNPAGKSAKTSEVQSEWSLPPTPGSFIMDDETAAAVHRRQASTVAGKMSFAASQRMIR